MTQQLPFVTDEPLWITTLRDRCTESSQASVATAIGYSTAVVNQVLKGTYRGDVRKVEMAVRGAYLGETVGCPILGELPANQCLEYQRQVFAPTNSQRVRIYRACRDGCPYSQIGKERKP